MQTDLRARTALVAPAGGGAGDGHPDSNTRLAWLRTQLAVERTLMAWNRTSLSLIGFGFTIYQFLKKLQEIVEPSGLLRPQAPRNFGLAFVVVGTLGTLIALWQHRLYAKYLRGPEFKGIAITGGMPHGSLPLAVTVFLAVIGLATSVWVLLGG